MRSCVTVSSVPRFALATMALIAAFSVTVQAVPATYTFSGNATGTIGGTAFSGPFTATFSGDTSNVDMTNPPFYRLNNVGGTFTEGAITATFVPTVTLVSNASLDLINFYNATFDNGLGYEDPSLAGYMLTTSFGPVTGANDNSTFNSSGDGFLTSDGLLEFTGETGLTFSARVGVPDSGAGTAGLLLLGVTSLAWTRAIISNRRVALSGLA
jgi:hypothetical protein